MTTQTQFAIGDRVRVTSSAPFPEFIGAEGIVHSFAGNATYVSVTGEERKRVKGRGYDTPTEWRFHKDSFTLELVDQKPEPYEEWFV